MAKVVTKDDFLKICEPEEKKYHDTLMNLFLIRANKIEGRKTIKKLKETLNEARKSLDDFDDRLNHGLFGAYGLGDQDSYERFLRAAHEKLIECGGNVEKALSRL